MYPSITNAVKGQTMPEKILPKTYIVDDSGMEQKVNFAKLRIEFSDGNNISIKIGICNPEKSQQIIIVSHRGAGEDQIDEKYGTLLTISPASGNVIFVKPVSFKRGHDK